MTMVTTNWSAFFVAIGITIFAIGVGWFMAREYYKAKIEELISFYERERKEYRVKTKSIKKAS